MKIAYILPVNMKRYGYSVDNFLQTHFSVEIAREVAKKGHEVELHVFWDENITYTDNNLKVYFYKTDFNMIFRRDFTEVSLGLLNKEFDEDFIIHFHEPLRLFFVPFMLKNRSIVITEHHGLGIGNPIPRRSLFHPIFGVIKRTTLKKLLNTCRAHIVHNTPAMNSFSAYVKDGDSILLSANGINVANYTTYNKEDVRKELGLGNETIILFAGRICTPKGIKELIKAFEIVKEQRSNMRLVLAGPLHEERLRPLVEKYWIGFKNPQELQKWYTASDIFCLPTFGEAFGIVLLEALYHALPVITTDIPGIREWFPHENAIFVPPKDTDSLKNAIDELMDEKKRKRMIKNSRQIVLDNYTWEKVCQRYIDLYRSYSVCEAASTLGSI
ncbi:MAG: glycosyltransferase family 4 protein [Ktedonobacteraceae bacterium]